MKNEGGSLKRRSLRLVTPKSQTTFSRQHVAGKEELSLVEYIYLGDRHSATVKQAPHLQS